MAGELILPLAHGFRSVDHTATAVGKRGDLVELAGGPGFLLEDVAANGVVAVAMSAPLVTVPQPTPARAWKAGDPVYLSHDREFIGVTPIARASIGYVHHDTPDTEERVPVVWETGPGHYYQSLNPMTDPKYDLTPVDVEEAAAINIGNRTQYTQTLTTTSTRGIAPGVPIQVDYEGDLLVRTDKGVNMEFSVGYRMWHDDAAKVATIWTVAFRDARKGTEVGISMDSFSNANPLAIGAPIPNDDGGVTTITAQDFEDGIPVQVLLRLRGYSQNNHTNRTAVKFTLLEMENAQLVTRQWGARVI